MRIVALITVRNEEYYISRCLEHLSTQGVEFIIIDNDSADQTISLASQFKGRGLIDILHLPFKGVFELAKILELEEKLSTEINADWFMHYDADEIRESPWPEVTLKEAITRVDQEGYNSINFYELVFVPHDPDVSYIGRDYVKEMKYYYFHCPIPQHRINAWKKQTIPVNLVERGGHKVNFKDQKIYPESFILRHYIGLSKSHLENKYGKRRYSIEHTMRKWGRNRSVSIEEKKIILPSISDMHKVVENGPFDFTSPLKTHLIFLPVIHKNPETKITTINTSRFSRNINKIRNFFSFKKPLPILVGAYRSGLNLLSDLLSAHSDIIINSEYDFFNTISNTDTFMTFVNESAYNLNNSEKWTYSQIKVIRKSIRNLFQIHAQKANKIYYGGKLTDHFHNIPLIQKILPEASFIHIVRDGRDVALSMRKIGADPYSFLANARYWKMQLQSLQENLISTRYIQIKFEDLLTSPSEVLQYVCAFIRIPFEEKMLNIIKSYLNSNENVSKIKMWQSQMTSEQIQIFQQNCQPLLTDFGYELT